MFSTPKARKNTAALLAALGVTTGITAIGAATAGAASNVTLVFTSQYNGNNQLDNWITCAIWKFFNHCMPFYKCCSEFILYATFSQRLLDFGFSSCFPLPWPSPRLP